MKITAIMLILLLSACGEKTILSASTPYGKLRKQPNTTEIHVTPDGQRIAIHWKRLHPTSARRRDMNPVIGAINCMAWLTDDRPESSIINLTHCDNKESTQ